MSALLYHVFDSREAAEARQREIDDASGYPCFVQGYTVPEGAPAAVWTEHAESVRAHPKGDRWAIAAIDLATVSPVEAIDGSEIDTSASIDLGGGKPGDLGGGKVGPGDMGGQGVVKVPPAPGPVVLLDPVELDDGWNGLPVA
jgi:hypothetical protein